jgi:hypothetical protein
MNTSTQRILLPVLVLAGATLLSACGGVSTVEPAMLSSSTAATLTAEEVLLSDLRLQSDLQANPYALDIELLRARQSVSGGVNR